MSSLLLVVGYISFVVEATYSYQHSFQQLNSGFKKVKTLPPAAFQLHGADVMFAKPKNFRGKGYRKLASQRYDEQTKNLSSFTATDSSTKGFVSTATNFLNWIDVDDAQGYVESRWNMVGDLYALPWRPRINVVGRTKFWYKCIAEQKVVEAAINQDSANASRNKTSSPSICSTQVYFYDESWEIPASQALLQLITPTIM